jgi:hypothetical protein
MKGILANKLALGLIGGVVVVGVGAGVYFGVIHKNTGGTSNNSTSGSTSGGDFQRTGEKSFGLDVCNEMTKAEVANSIGKPVVRTDDYSNGGSTGCEYFISGGSFVIIDVGFGDMANQKKGLAVLDRTFKTDSRIKLENFLAYTEVGLNDVYMNVAPGQKYVRVGRSSVSAVSEETLIKLAIATEAKIRSYK